MSLKIDIWDFYPAETYFVLEHDPWREGNQTVQAWVLRGTSDRMHLHAEVVTIDTFTHEGGHHHIGYFANLPEPESNLFDPLGFVGFALSVTPLY